MFRALSARCCQDSADMSLVALDLVVAGVCSAGTSRSVVVIVK